MTCGLALGGCLGDAETCDDCIGVLELAWTFRTTDGVVQPCPDGYDIVDVTMTPAAPRDRSRSYGCTAFGSRSYYPGGSYDMVVAITNADGELHVEARRTVTIPTRGQTVRVEIGFPAP